MPENITSTEWSELVDRLFHRIMRGPYGNPIILQQPVLGIEIPQKLVPPEAHFNKFQERIVGFVIPETCEHFSLSKLFLRGISYEVDFEDGIVVVDKIVYRPIGYFNPDQNTVYGLIVVLVRADKLKNNKGKDGKSIWNDLKIYGLADTARLIADNIRR